MFLMWLGEQITQRGIGNGISLIIFVGIIAEIPAALAQFFESGRSGALSTPAILGVIFMLIATLFFVVFHGTKSAQDPHPVPAPAGGDEGL